MKILTISPILIVLLISLISILIYLYKTSELMNKRKLLIMIISFVFIFIVFNIIYYYKYSPPKQKFKLLVFPLITKDDQDLDQKWLLQAIPEIMSQKLYRTVKDRAIVAPIEWTDKTIKHDSLNDIKYLSSFCERIEFTHYFCGTLSKVNEKFLLNYKLQLPNQQGISDTITFSLEQLLPTVESITKMVLGYLSFPEPELIQPQYSASIAALNYYMEGYRSFLDSNYALALEYSSQAISNDSSFAEAYSLAAQSYFAIGVKRRSKDASEAIVAFKKTKYLLTRAMEIDSTDDENYRLWGEYYIYNERWSPAELMLNKAFQLNRNNSKLYISLSNFHNFRYQKLGFRDIEQLYNRAIYINPCYEEVYILLSDHYLFQNKRNQAIQILEKFLDINPNSIAALMALSKIYIVRNERSKIVELLNKIIELAPEHSDAYYNLGILHYNSNDFKNAKNLFTRAIAIDNHLNSYIYLAYISELEGNLDGAIDYLRKRIHFKIGPDDEFAEEARKHLFKLIQSDSTKRKEMEIKLDANIHP